jgi:ferredoxin/mono/diheme cytochrome c family protein/coenzyme F420-reducing hydrogenase delta subunit
MPSQVHLPSAPNDSPASTVDWPLRQANPVRRLLNWLERISLALEKPIVRIVHEPQFNPLYHTGTITLFALLIILVTGIYLTMFFPFGFEDSYQAVARMEANFVGRLMRALHRYASALAILTALLHGWRTFFMDRFRGPRWLAWVTGIVMTVLLWGAGLTGYWLIFDERAQLFNQALIDLLDGFTSGVGFLNRFLLTEAAGQGWLFILGVLTVHIGLSVIVGLFFYVHIKRLRRAKILPPRYWMAILGGLLVIGALLVPVGMLPPADFGSLPAQVPLDVFLLFYLPAALRMPPVLFWGGVIVIVTLLSLVPWLLLRKRLQPVQVHADRCTGCTLCAADCPYKAITMVERTDSAPHKFLAVVNPKMCVSCGVCIGSCPPLALTLGDQPAEPLWQEAVAKASQRGALPVRVVFTCERHAAQGARKLLDQPERAAFGGGKRDATAVADNMAVAIIPLTCIGMAHPDLAGRALAAGAAEVQFVGCPPEDCANREGNLWMEHRLERQRLPKLRRDVARDAIHTEWDAPNEFPRAIAGESPRSPATTYGLRVTRASLRSFVPALLLLAAVLAVTIALTGVSYRPASASQAAIRIDLRHRSGFPVVATETDVIQDVAPNLADAAPPRLVVEIDGQAVLDKTYPWRGGAMQKPVQALEQMRIPPGDHQLRVLVFDQAGQSQPQVVVDQAVSLEAGQILPLQLKDVRLGGDTSAGERLFKGETLGTNTGCQVCHSLEPGVRLVGPSLAGVATRAETSVPGLSAKEYLRQSIVEPRAHVVESFPANQMPPNFAETLTEQQIADIVEFLLTLR